MDEDWSDGILEDWNEGLLEAWNNDFAAKLVLSSLFMWSLRLLKMSFARL
jgi:hypothetical protein